MLRRTSTSWWRRCSRVSSVILAFVLNLGACLAQAGPLWYADGQALHRLETDTNAIERNVTRSGVLSVALNAKDGTFWALTGDRLLKYNADGGNLLNLDLRFLSGRNDSGRRLAFNAADETLWVAMGTIAFRVDANGRLVAVALATFFSGIQDIALAKDGTLWVLGNDDLLHFAANGALLRKDDLPSDMRQSELLVLDEANGVMWLGGSRKIFQIDGTLPVRERREITRTESVDAMTLAPATGVLWAVGNTRLIGYALNGSVATTTSLSALNLDDPRALVFDPASPALWLGHRRGLSRFSAAGQFVRTVPNSSTVVAIATAPAGVVPLVTLVSPANNAVLQNAFAPIRLHYSATCGGQPCNFPSSAFAAYVLTATLNGQSIGGSFTFDPATNDAVYVPTTRHAEGLNTLSAFVTDTEGRRSAVLNAQFTVDSIAPAFGAVTPASGTVFLQPNITLQGSINDSLGRVALENFGGATVTGANPQGPSFTWQIALAPGSNSFRLTATDALGNATQLPLTYAFSTLSIAITSPANGATIDADRVTVSGTFSGASTATVTVNGVPAVVTGTAFSAANVPLNPGTNTITATGTTPQGATASASITVTSAAPALTIVSPANGATVNGDSVLVRGTFTGPTNSGISVNEQIAALGGGGNFSAVVPIAPGANTITATVTSPGGSTSTRSVTVNANGTFTLVKATADRTAGLAPLAVTFTIENPTASNVPLTFDGAGIGTLPAGATASFAVTYPAGVFTASIGVTEPGGTFTQSFVIQSFDVRSRDAFFQAIFAGVKTNLAAGNIEGALVYFSPGVRDHYRTVLNNIAASLPALFGSFPPIRPTAMSDTDAEYFVVQTEGGRRYGYRIYFALGGDGVWRLQDL
jgi:glucodextranase-like protein